MSARKIKTAKRSPRRKGAKAPALTPGPTRAQQAARRRLVAASGVKITKGMREKLLREHMEA
jgi:hypothetical protein